MMGVHQTQDQLFSYSVQLDRRVRPDHPLRAIAAAVDFDFVRAETARFYGHNGHVSTDPVIILKLIFLLFFDNVASERELMGVVGERLDYLWFLGLGLEDAVPNHSVLSKARTRWGQEVFQSFFVRVVLQCVQQGLVEGSKIHMDSSFVTANASKDGVLSGSPQLIAALKAAYHAQESKLSESPMPPGYKAVNDRVISPTDPDASLVSRQGAARLRYHHHRAIDDAHGVITAVHTTPGSIVEQSQLMKLVDQHEANTEHTVRTVVADSQYGTVNNFLACWDRGLHSHMGDGQKHRKQTEGIFPESSFLYQAKDNTYLCPAGQLMRPGQVNQKRGTAAYTPARGVCANCPLKKQCTKGEGNRTLHRQERHVELEQARSQSKSPQGRRDRWRRQQLMERSFADAANNHGFKRARWRRLWRQQIQDWMIAAVQNIRILVKRAGPPPAAALQAGVLNLMKAFNPNFLAWPPLPRMAGNRLPALPLTLTPCS